MHSAEAGQNLVTYRVVPPRDVFRGYPYSVFFADKNRAVARPRLCVDLRKAVIHTHVADYLAFFPVNNDVSARHAPRQSVGVPERQSGDISRFQRYISAAVTDSLTR